MVSTCPVPSASRRRFRDKAEDLPDPLLVDAHNTLSSFNPRNFCNPTAPLFNSSPTDAPAESEGPVPTTLPLPPDPMLPEECAVPPKDGANDPPLLNCPPVGGLLHAPGAILLLVPGAFVGVFLETSRPFPCPQPHDGAPRSPPRLTP